MKIAYLGPFTTSLLKPFIPTITEKDCEISPGMGGTALTNLVLPRLKMNKPTVIISLDTNLKNSLIKRSYGNFTYYSLPKRKNKSLRDLYSKEKDFIINAVNDSKPDLLHIHWTTEYALAVRNLRIPKLLTVHDNAFDILKYSGISWFPLFILSVYLILKYKNVTADSPYVRNFIQKFTSKNIDVVFNPIDNLPFENATRKNRTGIIIKISAGWNKLKNIDKAILAFSYLLKEFPEAKLILTGPGMGLKGPCQEWALSNRLERNIEFLGMLKYNDMLKILSNSTIYLHTSKTESYSLAVSEAMLLGIPVIAGERSGGIPFQLDFGKAGLLVNIDKPVDIANSMKKLLMDSLLYEKYKIAGIKRAIEFTDPDQIMLKYDKIYTDLISEYNIRNL